MKYEIVLNSKEVKELKEELTATYKMVNGEEPSEKWLTKTIIKMLNITSK